MKPASFSYYSPETIDEALRVLAEFGEDGKVLAGGQSLVPLLNFRLARPNTLIDINRVAALSYIRRRNGHLHIGTLTRQADLERSPLARASWPILGEALRELAHPQIRNRGTIGGSVAHADPSAELPVVLTALGARFVVRSETATRTLSAEQMFQGQLTTGLQTDELLVEICVPELAAGTGWAFAEFARQRGDFALGGVAVLLRRRPNANGIVEGVRVVMLGAGPTPRRAIAAERLLESRPFETDLAQQAAAAAAAAAEPPAELHGDRDYRRQLIASLTVRALVLAWERSG